MKNMNLPSVSVGFPVYNEEATISEVLESSHRLLANSGLDYEILVCNDGSTDRSPEKIREMVGRFPDIRVINHPRNIGIHASFEHLYKESRKDFIFVNASDRQWDTAIILKMLPLVRKCDIVIARRKKKNYGLWREFISWFFNMVPRALFGIHTFDAGAVKLMKREIIEKFTLVSKTPFSEAERLIRATRAGYRIIDYPVETSPRRSGRSHGIRMGVLFGAMADVWRVWYAIYFRERSARAVKRV
ncbi:MAG: glycosyltransferase family 2 protein [Candidatus Omnitrophica bacterium]|nr:glycosyltransferase family 2 protein [Candidatus Omnitrophota bacterium]